MGELGNEERGKDRAAKQGWVWLGSGSSIKEQVLRPPVGRVHRGISGLKVGKGSWFSDGTEGGKR